MSMPDIKVPHIGKKIERIREIKGMKQDGLATALGVSQQTVSRMEASEVIDDDLLERVAKVFGIQVDAIKNFNEEAVFNYFNNFNDHSTGFNYNCTFNPIEKVIELVEKNEKLYERLLREKDTVIETLQELRKSS